MKSYDLVYIVRPDLESDAVKAVVDRMSQRITGQGGTIEAVDVWGKKRTTFTLKKFREGLYVHTRFAIDPSKVEEIRRAAALTEDVLRAMITNAVGKLPEPKTEAAPAVPAAVPPVAAPAAPETAQPTEASGA